MTLGNYKYMLLLILVILYTSSNVFKRIHILPVKPKKESLSDHTDEKTTHQLYILKPMQEAKQ